MLVLDSTNKNTGIFDTISDMFEDCGKYYGELRNIFTMQGNIKLHIAPKAVVIIISEVERNLHGELVKVNVIIILDKDGIEAMDSSMNSILHKYNIQWSPGYGFATFLSAIEEIDENGSLACWTPKIIEGYVPQANSNVSHTDLQSFLSDLYEEEEYECIENCDTCPEYDKCDNHIFRSSALVVDRDDEDDDDYAYNDEDEDNYDDYDEDEDDYED